MITLSRPANKDFGTGFGPRPKPTPTSPAIHYGQDYGWGSGAEIYAAADGVVTSTSYSGAYGNRTVVDHGNGVQTWYCHQSVQMVAVGDKVARRQQIGVMGKTGNTVGIHLHFELRVNGVATDPAPYMSSTASNGLTPIEVDPDMAFDDNAVKLLMDTAENARATREFLARLTTGIGGLPTGDAPQTLLAEAAMHRALKEPYRLLAVMFQGAAPDKASAVEVAFAAKWGKLLAAAEAGGFNAGDVAQLRGLTLTLTGTAEPVALAK